MPIVTMKNVIKKPKMKPFINEDLVQPAILLESVFAVNDTFADDDDALVNVARKLDNTCEFENEGDADVIDDDGTGTVGDVADDSPELDFNPMNISFNFCGLSFDSLAIFSLLLLVVSAVIVIDEISDDSLGTCC
ncbi:hypothetical protein DERP_006800 [Dermatophagoides pteronyssinus]|uniref:Uncharacterized protein n=1 Tax=Dermatophagoides pteronyssinus TaxID=6956 RepID=A0ABQ8IS25_DERPT|nr:hypothetical protein DERP_006800 [Dermatophagoides pteronyssinus]